MRLIIGGVYQGRQRYAYGKYGEDIKIYRDVFERVKSLVADGQKESEIVNIILDESKKSDVVIAEEQFSGLASIKKDENHLYEVYGRCLTLLAAEAESVERVVCGLGQSLK